jgi:hypothetical protein
LTGDHIRACRKARQLVADMAWRGMPVPPLYAHMAAEFQDLVAGGDYAAWLAGGVGSGATSQPDRAVRPLPPAPA